MHNKHFVPILDIFLHKFAQAMANFVTVHESLDCEIYMLWYPQVFYLSLPIVY